MQSLQVAQLLLLKIALCLYFSLWLRCGVPNASGVGLCLVLCSCTNHTPQPTQYSQRYGWDISNATCGAQRLLLTIGFDIKKVKYVGLLHTFGHSNNNF